LGSVFFLARIVPLAILLWRVHDNKHLNTKLLLLRMCLLLILAKILLTFSYFQEENSEIGTASESKLSIGLGESLCFFAAQALA